MTHTFIELKSLEPSPDNARRTATKAAIDELKASLLAHGLMQNLVVTAVGDGRYRVIAGSRRLEALRQLEAEGKLPADHDVACQIVADDHAFELSLAENTVRRAMHPADEFEAFARLADEGESAERIAGRFGVTERHVQQRLKLGGVAPELLDAYRAEALTLECLMAFTITDDREKQLAVYRSLLPWQTSKPHEIRALLADEMAEATSKLAKFVGLDAYHAAGGVSRADLFGDEVYLESPDLLNRLAAEKLDGVRRELEAEGWKWVEVSPDPDWNIVYSCGRIHPRPMAVPPELLDRKAAVEAELEAIAEAADVGGDEEDLFERQEDAEARLAEIEEELESFAAYDPAETATAGCYVTIGHDGGLTVEKGLVRREDIKRMEGDAGDSPAKPKGMPEALRRDLEAYRLQAAQVELARHPLIALDLLAFQAARSAVARQLVHDGPDVRFTQHSTTPAVQKERTVAGEAIEAIAEALPRNWLLPETEAEQFQAFLGLSERDRLAFLAYGVAISLKPQLSIGRENTAYELALSMTDADVAAYWRPTKSNCLGRITRDQLLALGRELLGERWAQARGREKKGTLADELERAFADPERYTRDPERREALKHWLPEGMPFGAAEPHAAEAHERQAA